MIERNSSNSEWVRARGEWLGRYRMCVAVDRVNTDTEKPGFAAFALERSAYRWRAVTGLARVYERFADEDEPLEAYGLSNDALEWLEDAAHRRGFVVDWSAFMRKCPS